MPTIIIIGLVTVMIIGIVYIYIGRKKKDSFTYKLGLGVFTGMLLLIILAIFSFIKILNPTIFLSLIIITLVIPTYLMIGKWTPKFK